MKGGWTVRRKLFSAFAALATIALLASGVTLYTTLRWQATNQVVQTHFQRSLLLQHVRAATFQALKEVDDALNGDVADAERDFERALTHAERDFGEWAALADTQAERREVATVRAAYDRLLASARRLFRIARTDLATAAQIADDELDTKDFEAFRILTEQGVQADRTRRASVVRQTQRVRQTTQIMATIAILSILSLILLISAFLSQDLLRPLHDIRGVLDKLRAGDLKARADADRGDEIGMLAASVNQLATALQRREAAGDEAESGWRDQPSNVTVHRLVAALCGRLDEIKRDGVSPEAIADADHLARAIGRFTAIGFPLDLQFERIDLTAFLHDVVARFRRELTDRAVTLEIAPGPDLQPIAADRLKLREAVCEAIRNALDALPKAGGRIGIRTLAGDSGFVRIEVADDGRGMAGDMVEQALDADPFGNVGRPRVGLALARAIVERHGGTLTILSEAGRGTVARFSLPHRQ